MTTLTRLAQCEHGAPRDNFPTMRQKDLDQILQVAQLGLAVDQRHHVDAEGVLQLGLLVEVVQHHLWHFPALELNHQPHAGLVAFVLDVTDAFYFLLMHQFGHTLLKRLFIHLVGELVNDDGLPLAFVDIFKMASGAHYHLAATGAVAVLHAVDTVNNASCWKVRSRNDFHQFIDGCLGIFKKMQAGINRFVQIVWRNVGCHPDCNPRRTIDQQVRESGRHNQRFILATVVVWAKIHSLFVQIGKQLVCNLGHPDFGVTHGCRIVAIDRTEVSLAVNQHVAK